MATATTKDTANADGYVVLTDAFTYKTGPKVEDAARARRGSIVYPNPEFTDIDRMVALKAIAPNDGSDQVATTARAAAQAAGGVADQTPNVPVHETLPVQPTGTDESGLLPTNDGEGENAPSA